MKLKEFLNKLAQKVYSENEANLLSFSPQKTPKSNQYILKQIKVATCIKNRRDNNIALDGDYGVGKSSILYNLKSNFIWRIINRPKTISFLSFPADKNNSEKHQSEKNGAKNEDTRKDKIDSKYLQSEIIRQLYYGERSNKLKGSGYKRIGKHYLFGSLFISMILGTFLLLRIYHINTATFINTLVECVERGINPNVSSTYTLAWVAIVTTLTLLVNAIFKLIANGDIKSISAKDLSIELSDSEPDFNQLIDLLIYYFRKTKRRVIIFEDLDRLQNPKIFEELRQLNFTLNNRIKPFGTIKFIYATRSDLFITNTPEDTGIEKINTKVFDLIIPVIPFLTKVNFSNVLQDECKTIGLDRKINGIENILSRHTSDMRVVKAVLNNILVYKNTFDLQTDDDYKNAAALSILRVFAPSDYMKLSTGNSLLDLMREQCTVKKEASIKQAQEKRTPEHKIKQNSKAIWAEIRNIGNQIPQNINPQNVIIDNEQAPTNENALIRIYKTRQDANIQIHWNNYSYGQRKYTAKQLQDVMAPFVKDSSSVPIEKEIQELAERDCFTFYDNSIIPTGETTDKKTQEIVQELLTNNFATEGYTRFITQANNMNIDVDNALRYVFSYVRSNKRNDEYVLNSVAATEVMSLVDNTDLMSAGMYNFSLFDFIIKNLDRYSDNLELILQNAKADLDSLMDFFDNYCHKYKNELEPESCIGINGSTIIETAKTIPPAFLAMKLAKMYPKELMAKVTHSSLNDTNAKEVIYNVAVVSLNAPQDLVLEEQDRSFLKYYADTILKNENGKENLFQLFIANNIPINNLEGFGISNDDVRDYLDKILIVINEQNLAILDDDVSIEYITAHQLTSDDFAVVMKSNRPNIKQFIVKNIDKVISNNYLPECIQEAAAYVYEKKIPLTVEELLQYAGKTNPKNLIEMILIPDLTKEDVAKIMSKCNDGNLNKIQIKNSLIKLPTNRNNEAFAKELEELGLTSIQKGRKDKKMIWLQVS